MWQISRWALAALRSAVGLGCCCSCCGQTSRQGNVIVPLVCFQQQQQQQQGQTSGCILLDEEHIHISSEGKRKEGHPCQADVVGRPHTCRSLWRACVCGCVCAHLHDPTVLSSQMLILLLCGPSVFCLSSSSTFYCLNTADSCFFVLFRMLCFYCACVHRKATSCLCYSSAVYASCIIRTISGECAHPRRPTSVLQNTHSVLWCQGSLLMAE